MAGVDFTDGEQVTAGVGSSLSSGSMSEGGPLDTPTDEKGRSSSVSPSNEEGTPRAGSDLDSPTD
jgi:hypothetical protein